ncbi:MAG: PEP-CTERM sorting domain-containing protein [Burkholderiales bacterium PBB5]|nr:MAG: PEP-CTERM sorting domain-containing protein [Burkholderiales bacterium PBB5]
MKIHHTQRFAARELAVAAALTASVLCSPALADTSRLQSLLAAAPADSWIQVNTGSWSSAWPTGSTAVQGAGNNTRAVVTAWSSFAWDSANDSLLLWGGGHANYKGNEMYVWDAGLGTWSLGSLPSRIDANNYVVDNAAPQSSHTYDNNLYLPVNNMFVTFGGAAYNSGGNFSTNINGVVQRAGPWLWDPTKADSTKVGGTTGSGYNASTLGGSMWTNRASSVTGSLSPNYLEDATAYRTENGKDVVYVTSDSQGSGYANLYRYEFGDVRNGGVDKATVVGVTATKRSSQGAATIDSTLNLFVRTASFEGASAADLVVWNLANNNNVTPQLNPEIAVTLKTADGADFSISTLYGIDYDSDNGKYYLWNGTSLWSTQASYDAKGKLLTTWKVTLLSNTGSTVPNGNYVNGVIGKWHYIEELGAFMALDEYSTSTGDAGVWLYKPTFTSAVPEAPAALMLAGGLGMLLRSRRLRSAQQALR